MSRFSHLIGVVCLVTLGLAMGQRVQADVCEPAPDDAVNDTEHCRALWEKIGLPTGGDDLDATAVCHTRYVLLHNNAAKTPFWVIEPLNKKQVSGKFKRPDSKKFKSEDGVCEPAQAKDGDYTGSKLDRGHQAASADFSADSDWMDESFILSNAVPQQGLGFNRGIWKEFEQLVRTLTKDRGELYVITGPVYADDGKLPQVTSKNNACKTEIKFDAPKRPAICGSAKKCDPGVAVPIALFKILYDPSMKRANAYVLPNIDHRPFEEKDSLEYLKGFRTTVKVVERLTGFQFLTDIPGRKAQVEECVATMLH